MQSTQKLSLDDTEAAQVKLYPLTLLNYSQFVVIGALPPLAMLAIAVAIGYHDGFVAFVLALLRALLVLAFVYGLVLVGIPFALSRLKTPKTRWIAGGIAAAFLVYVRKDGIGFVFGLALLLLPFAQSSVLCRLKRGPTLAAAIVMWATIAVSALGVLLYASDLDVHRGELMFLILGMAPAIAVVWTLANRYLFISRISDQTRSLLQAHFPSVFSLEALRVFAGVPPVWNYLQSNKKLTFALFLLSSLFNGLALATAFALTMVGVRAMKVPGEALAIAFVMLLIAFPALAILMQICDRIARAKTRISAKELIATDTRKPVLFLRAFADDQVELPAASLGPLGAVLSLGRHRKSLDELLLDEGTLYGPVVALGNPKEKVPPYGVARGYFENTEWKRAVSDLARDSSLIILCIDDTESVWWEVEHIFQRGYADKTLFVLPPKHRSISEDKSLLPRLIQRLPSVPEATFRDLVEACSRSATIAVSIGPAGNVSIANSQTFSGFAYLALLRWFMRSRIEQTVPQATFEPATEPAFAGASATFAMGEAGAAGTASYASTVSAADPSSDADQDPWSQPGWMKHLHRSGRGFGFVGPLVVGLIEGLYYLGRYLLLKVRTASTDRLQSTGQQPQAQASQTYSASPAARSSNVAGQSFDPSKYLQSLARTTRDLRWPDWAKQKPALAGGAALATLLFLGWVVSGSHSVQTTNTFTSPSYSPSPASYSSSPAPTTISTNRTTANDPYASDPSDAYRRLYEEGYVFNPSVPPATSASERCMTSMLNATLAEGTPDYRRQNNLVARFN